MIVIFAIAKRAIVRAMNNVSTDNFFQIGSLEIITNTKTTIGNKIGNNIDQFINYLQILFLNVLLFRFLDLS